jgi:hypothetical protein
MERGFDLILFSTRADFIRSAVAAGVSGVIVDWESLGKRERQASNDTQINGDTLEDLRRVRACTRARVLCRINPFGDATEREVEEAIEAGADELMLPMVRSPMEPAAVLKQVAGRCGVGILVETVRACQLVDELAQLPLSRVYVGLNDLAIDRGVSDIFRAVADGTVERIRGAFELPFGFAGLTLPERGHPIPCRLLIGELIRLGCSFSFLRRSFHADVRLRAALVAAGRRSPEAVERDRVGLRARIAAAAESR